MQNEYVQLVEAFIKPKKGSKVNVITPDGTYDGMSGVVTKIVRKGGQVTYVVDLVTPDGKEITGRVFNPEEITVIK